MEGSSTSNKRKGDGLREGESVPKRQMTVVGMEVFHCAVCSHPLRPPIFECSDGSFICSRCCDELPESERAATKRCSSMERIVNNIFVPCKHGCSTTIAYHKKDAHERECPVRPCACPVSGCAFVASTAALLDHLTALHKLPKTPIELFDLFYLTVQPGSQVLFSEDGRLFLLDVVAVESVGRAVSLVYVRPETSQDTVLEVFVEFSCDDIEGHFQASKIEITPDRESRQCLCVVPSEEAYVEVKIIICMVHYDNEELLEEEDEYDHMFDYNFDEEEEMEEEVDEEED